MTFFKKNKKIFFAVLGIAIFFLIILINKEVSWQSLTNLNYKYLALVIVFSYLATSLSAIRWGWIVNTLANKKIIPYRKYIFYYSLGYTLGSFLGQEIVNFSTSAGALLIEKVSPKKIVNAYIIDKFLNTINLACILWVSVFYFLGLTNEKLSTVLIIISWLITYLIISYRKTNFTSLLAYLNNWLQKLANIIPFLKNKGLTVDQPEEKIIIEPKILRKMYLVSIAKFILAVTATFYTFKTLNLTIGIIKTMLALPIAQLSIVFAITPGAIGILETGWFILLKLLGFPALEINTFLIGSRVLYYLGIIITFIASYILVLTVKKEKI